MLRFITRRLLQAIPTLVGIMAITFILTRVAPSDPIDLLLPRTQDFDPAERERLRQFYGLNDPLPLQFAKWSWDALRLDFGDSFVYHRPVLTLLAETIPNSLQLSVAALVLSLAIGVPLGVVAAVNRGRRVDHAIRLVSVLGHAIPTFWFGLLFLIIFSSELRWFPTGGMNDLGREGDIANRLWHLIGPVATLALAGIANYPRYLRTEVLEILGQDFIRTARGKGLPERVVLSVHVLRNALIPVVTLLGGILAIFMSGAVVIEQVFSWPGLGRLLFDAANSKDYPVVQASVLFSGVLLLVSYVLRDIAYAAVDPRIKIE